MIHSTGELWSDSLSDTTIFTRPTNTESVGQKLAVMAT